MSLKSDKIYNQYKMRDNTINRRDGKISAKVTPEEKKAIIQEANKRGLDGASFLRTCALKECNFKMGGSV